MSPSSFSFWILLIFQTPWDVLEKDLQMAVKEKEKVGKKIVGLGPGQVNNCVFGDNHAS